jgi:hypothetical protein
MEKEVRKQGEKQQQGNEPSPDRKLFALFKNFDL